VRDAAVSYLGQARQEQYASSGFASAAELVHRDVEDDDVHVIVAAAVVT
jgi:hypothetical protein